MKSSRRAFLQFATLATTSSVPVPTLASVFRRRPTADVKPFELDELTLSELQRRMASGKLSADALTKKYLARIDQIDRRGPTLRSVIELNPDALTIAASMDRERNSNGPRGTLHGIPVLVKDNIDSHDQMTTTAGSMALSGSIPPRDAFLVERLRASGAVLLGKANLSEWANIRASHSTSGWSARGGQTRNPYALDRDPSGSSSGSAVAVSANLCPVAVGTETDGSILSPSLRCGIVGIKPTVGLVSRSGIIPISHSQDTAGPMARTVTDAAILLGAMTGEDPRDSATAASTGHAHTDYTQFLDPEGLRGARIGVARKTFTGHPRVAPLMDRLLDAMKQRGAILIDPIELPPYSAYGPAEFEVLLYEFKAGLNAYLASLGPNAPVHTLHDVIQFNEQHADTEMPWFGQDIFLDAEAKGPLTDQAYLDALAKCRRATRDDGIDALMNEHRLDAIFTSGGGPAAVRDYAYGDRGTGGGGIGPAAVAGYPSVTVPAGLIRGLPVGVIFLGRAWSEPTLLRIAYAFEQTTRARQKPAFLPAIAADNALGKAVS